MNFFKLYIGDYQRDTAHLSVTEHGAYLLMLQHYYATEKHLPVGKALHRMLRAQDKAERDAIDVVVAQFGRETPDGLVNDRADVEITKAGAQADTNARIAREREERRKAEREAHEKSTNRATNDQPNQTPDTRHQEPPPGVSGGKPPKPPPVEIPEWVPAEQWQAFVEMRRAKGKRAPFTVAAAKGIVEELGKLREQGQDPEAVLAQSVVNGWSGVFPVKGVNGSAPAKPEQRTFV